MGAASTAFDKISWMMVGSFVEDCRNENEKDVRTTKRSLAHPERYWKLRQVQLFDLSHSLPYQATQKGSLNVLWS